MAITIFKHYQNNLKKTVEYIPEIIRLSFEYLAESSSIENLIDKQQERLSSKGEYIDGQKLQTDAGGLINKPYSEYTIQKKGNRGFVDLYDTGSFYESMEAVAKKTALEFVADFEKEGGDISDNFTIQTNKKGFVDGVLGITLEDWNELKPHFIAKFVELFMLKFNKLI